MSAESISWSDAIGKEARTTNDSRLGIVVFTKGDLVVTERSRGDVGGVDRFVIPKDFVERFDGSVLWLRVSEDAALREFKVASTSGAQTKGGARTVMAEQDQKELQIPLYAEEMSVEKKIVTEYIVVRKIPVTETQTVKVPITRQEIVIERRRDPPPEGEFSYLSPTSSPSGSEETTGESAQAHAAATSKEEGNKKTASIEDEIRLVIPVTREEVEVRKEPRIKEEVILRKVPITEKRTLTEVLRSETVSEDESEVNVTQSDDSTKVG